MLRKKITYTDFDGNSRTEEFYFNLTQTELVMSELGASDNLSERIKRIVDAKDNAAIMQQFEKIILSAYGEKSADGKKFVKNAEISEAFKSSAAYDALFMELISNEGSAAEFIKSIIPKSN